MAMKQFNNPNRLFSVKEGWVTLVGTAGVVDSFLEVSFRSTSKVRKELPGDGESSNLAVLGKSVSVGADSVAGVARHIGSTPVDNARVPVELSVDEGGTFRESI